MAHKTAKEKWDALKKLNEGGTDVKRDRISALFGNSLTQRVPAAAPLSSITPRRIKSRPGMMALLGRSPAKPLILFFPMAVIFITLLFSPLIKGFYPIIFVTIASTEGLTSVSPGPYSIFIPRDDRAATYSGGLCASGTPDSLLWSRVAISVQICWKHS